MKNPTDVNEPKLEQTETTVKKHYDFGTVEKVELSPRENSISVFARVDMANGCEPFCITY